MKHKLLWSALAFLICFPAMANAALAAPEQKLTLAKYDGNTTSVRLVDDNDRRWGRGDRYRDRDNWRSDRHRDRDDYYRRNYWNRGYYGYRPYNYGYYGYTTPYNYYGYPNYNYYYYYNYNRGNPVQHLLNDFFWLLR